MSLLVITIHFILIFLVLSKFSIFYNQTKLNEPLAFLSSTNNSDLWKDSPFLPLYLDSEAMPNKCGIFIFQAHIFGTEWNSLRCKIILFRVNTLWKNDLNDLKSTSYQLYLNWGSTHALLDLLLNVASGFSVAKYILTCVLT